MNEDFESELAGKLPYKQILVAKQEYLDYLEAAFYRLDRLPSLSLYTASKMNIHLLLDEIEDKIPVQTTGILEYGSLEQQFRKDERDFNDKVESKSLDRKFYSRDINQLPEIRALAEVEGIMNEFDKYVEEHDDSATTYRDYANVVSDKIVSILQGLPFKDDILYYLMTIHENPNLPLARTFETEERAFTFKKRYKALKLFLDAGLGASIANRINPTFSTRDNRRIRIEKSLNQHKFSEYLKSLGFRPIDVFELFFEKSDHYRLALLKESGYLEYLEKEYPSSKDKFYKKIGAILDMGFDNIRKNIYAFKPENEAMRVNSPSWKFIDEVKQDLNTLRENFPEIP